MSMPVSIRKVVPMKLTRDLPGRPIYILCFLRKDLVKEPEWGLIKANCSKSGIQLEKNDGSYFEQRPYPRPLPDFIIHCIPTLHSQLCEFDSKHPNIIINHPDAIKMLFKRDTMLECVENLGISQVGIPKQKFVRDNNYDFKDLFTKQGGGLQFPVIIKTMEAGGSKASHIMHYASTMGHLEKLKNTRKISPPFVVQEFSDHGGTFTKVYVLRSRVWCTVMESTENSARWKVEDNVVTMCENRRPVNVDPESRELMEQIAFGLQDKLKLDTFNFDVIKVVRASGQHEFLIVDINYFPGYSKSKNYVALMTAYFQEVPESKVIRP